MIEKLDRLLRGTATLTCLTAGWALLVLSVVIAVNVVLRKMFDYAITGVDEYGGYCLAISSAFGFSLALYQQAHIRVTIVTDHLKPAIRACCNLLALLVLLVTAIVLTSRAFEVAFTSHELHARAVSALGTRLDIPQGLWVIGLLLFCLALLVQSAKVIGLIARRDWHHVNSEFGASDVEADIESELADARRRLG